MQAQMQAKRQQQPPQRNTGNVQYVPAQRPPSMAQQQVGQAMMNKQAFAHQMPQQQMPQQQMMNGPPMMNGPMIIGKDININDFAALISARVGKIEQHIKDSPTESFDASAIASILGRLEYLESIMMEIENIKNSIQMLQYNSIETTNKLVSLIPVQQDHSQQENE